MGMLLVMTVADQGAGHSSLRLAKAEEFDPDRFLDERLKKYFSMNPFIFLPFNAGPRICLGQQVRARNIYI